MKMEREKKMWHQIIKPDSSSFDSVYDYSHMLLFSTGMS